ncbi:MAG: hypothetical protein GX793_06260 [Bacteroidales bacterium]|jgi:hypothetical protein|nr:hypothetical protein [Bacteroidales bacterium]MCK9498347.1 hypothetical protein [Bacteroidales bacterium]MDY0314925.1 hypothetical protein [Bacteroidales bacterium]NLB86646.1 hypothetical protein [Bacteroidales bacterium]
MKNIVSIILIFFALNSLAQNYPLTEHQQNINAKLIYYENNFTLQKPYIGIENKTLDSLIFTQASGKYKNWFLRKIFEENLFVEQDSNFILILNPLIDFRFNYQNNAKGYHNTRGIVVNGKLASKIYFNTSFTESQAVFPESIKAFYDEFGVIPGYGRVKPLSGLGEFDFAVAYGNIAIKASKILDISFGYDKLFIGEGYRSLILSDFSAPMVYLKTSYNFKKIQFNRTFTKAINPNFNNVLQVENPVSMNSRYPSKYVSFNTLTYKLNSAWQISLVEALVFSKDIDLWNYPAFILVPFIRTTYINSNKLLTNNFVGLNTSWQNKNIGIIYSQIFIDKISKSDITASVQLGYKNFDFLKIKDLFLQVEYNRVPREMYLHPNNDLHFGHYNQALAHPAGAGFNEILAILDYKFKNFEFLIKTVFLKYAEVNAEYNQQNIFDYYILYKTDENSFTRNPVLISDFQLIYNLNNSYRLQVFTGISNRTDLNTKNKINFIQFGLRTAIRTNYDDF